MTSTPTTTHFEIVAPSDPRVETVLEDLVREYSTRYGDLTGHNARSEVYGSGLSEFTAPERGAFIVLFEGSTPLAAGALRALTEDVTEFKKIWSTPSRRGEGFAKLLLAELESHALQLGYSSVFLTTGPRQPEADRLYERSGYTAHFEPGAFSVHPYTKALTPDVDASEVPEAVRHLIEYDFADLVASPKARTTTDAPPTDPGERESLSAPAAASESASDDSVTTGPPAGRVVARRVRKRRHWGRWVLAVVALYLVALFVVSLFRNPHWQWDVFAQYFFSQAVVQGVGLTLALTAISGLFGFLFGGVLAVMRMSGSPVLVALSSGYIWFFRAVPLVVQLVVWYNLGYLWPTLGLGTPFTTDFWLFEVNTVTLISAFTAAVLGLSLHEAAYSAEIIRGGLLSVDSGQVEAARALGLPRYVRFFKIVLPQALRSIIPNAFNSVIGLVKGTSVVFVVALPELFYTVQVIYNRNQLVIPLLLVSVVWYAVITTVLNIAQFYIERHYARGQERELPPTPLQRVRRWFGARRPNPIPTPIDTADSRNP